MSSRSALSILYKFSRCSKSLIYTEVMGHNTIASTTSECMKSLGFYILVICILFAHDVKKLFKEGL
jgi:hypothetical protein